MPRYPFARFVTPALLLLAISATLFAEAPAAEELRPTPGWDGSFRRDSQLPEQARIPLGVDWADNELDRAAVTFGVPFPRGVLRDPANLRLVSGAGREVLADFRVSATWDGPNGPARWVLADATLERGEDWFVEYGRAVTRSAPRRGESRIALRETGELIDISNGPLRVTISRREPSLVRSIELAGTRGALVSPTRAADELPRVVDARGNVYFAGGPEHGLRVEVAESGPGRAAVRREGWYVNATGERFCGFVTYTYFYAGQAGFRHDHTLLVAFDSNAHQIRDIQLPLPLELDGGARVLFAPDDAPDVEPLVRDAGDGPVGLVQATHDRWELFGGGEPTAGRRAGGWFGLADGRRGALAGLTDFWQQYPAQLAADGDTLRVHLWPASGVDPLDLRPSAQMGDLYPGNQVFHGAWYRAGLDEMTQAYGLAKTHNIHFEFFSAAGLDDAWRSMRARCTKPVIAFADPAWACASEAAGRIHHRDPARFPEIEALLDTIIVRKLHLREAYASYGWVDFGDIILYGPRSVWRRWASVIYGFPNVPPRLFIRSGDRAAWDFHRVNARHIMDIDLCHLDSEEFNKTRGLRYAGDSGEGMIAHYACDPWGPNCDTHVEFMYLDYYLNGNLRAFEVADDYVRAHAGWLERGPIVSYQHRHTGGALRLFCEAWQATWDPEYLALMRRTAGLILEAGARDGYTRHDDVYMNRGMLLYYQLTGDERMRDLFLTNMARYNHLRSGHVLAGDSRATTMAGLAHAWFLTGDDAFLPFLHWQLRIALDWIPVEGEPDEIGAARGTFEHAYISTLGWQLPTVAALLAEAGELPAPDNRPGPVAEPLAVRSSRGFYVEKPAGIPLELTVETNLYRRHASEGLGSFRNWRELAAALPASERPELRLFGPDGEEVERFALEPRDWFQPVETRIALPVDAPAGTYALTVHAPAQPVELQLTACSVPGRVAPGGTGMLRGLHSYYFRVPAGTGRFQVEVKSDHLRGLVGAALRDPRGRVHDETEWRSGAWPDNRWRALATDADAPDEDEDWELLFHGPGGRGLFARFDGVPPFLASSPAELFTPAWRLPDEEPLAPAEPGRFAYLEAGLPWGGPTAWLPPPVTVTVADPAGERPLLDPETGTLEFWVRASDVPDNLVNLPLLDCGVFSLFRGFHYGTFVRFGSGHQWRTLVLPLDRWTHLAVTWQRAADGHLEVFLFIDGVRAGPVIRIAAAGDWPAERLVIPARPAGMFVSGLRVSGSVRYTENFPRPEAPSEADGDTRVLVRFDGDGQATVFGATVQLEVAGER